MPCTAEKESPMSKTKHTRASKNRHQTARRSKLKITVLVLAGFLCVTLIITAGSWGSVNSRVSEGVSPSLTTAAPAPVPAASPNLMREYIYAGNRLIATEDAGATVPNAPSGLSALLWGSAHLGWQDNSQNETGFKLESSTDGTTWTLFETLPANTMRRWWLSRLKTSLSYRVRAFNAAGDSAPSNVVFVPGRPLGGFCAEGAPGGCSPPGGVIISEYRSGGPLGSGDEYVELYNTGSQSITVCSADASSGWALVSSDGIVRFVVPYGTVIPAGAHYLAVGPGYSLSSEPVPPDLSYPNDIPDGQGIALFNTAYPESFTLTNRLDAVGFTNSLALYREGGGLALLGANTGEYAFLRKLNSTVPQDTGDNGADITLVATDAAVYGSWQAILGAPGPENLASPRQLNATLPVTMLDPAVGAGVAPNRVRDTTAIGPNAAVGTLSFRRTITNNTGKTLTRLRFRITDITTYKSPGYVPGGGQADMRLLTSPDFTAAITGGTQVLVHGTTLETPPAQSLGGGLNSVLGVGFINVSQPLLPGQSISVQWLVGLQQSGTFRFFVSVEGVTQ